ncbi:hypothetical protein [Campylobacter concisus]|uniref:hypothetical protein n=1 Tax=Campylobacter concisus TaxID=199 RepID=UPI0015D8E37F|nr:hypothetical protein [Campylobacter concisus]
MKKAILLSVILLTTSLSKDLFELGLEAYDKGEFDKAAKQWQKVVMVGILIVALI